MTEGQVIYSGTVAGAEFLSSMQGSIGWEVLLEDKGKFTKVLMKKLFGNEARLIMGKKIKITQNFKDHWWWGREFEDLGIENVEIILDELPKGEEKSVH